MWFITLLLMLSLTENRCFGCSCYPQDPLPVAFCKSSFVIKAKPVKVALNPPIEGDVYSSGFNPWIKRIYDVNVIEVFKTPDNVHLKPGDVIQAITDHMDSLCGGYLELDTEQLILGGVNDDGQITFDACSHTEPNGVTPSQLAGMRKDYLTMCY
ncbi:metalloproteinase inhibitor 1-like [Mytilus trossulus]|uniref:metalloproteinase inhibitor 1-like n=1 Tax=Mytilus trossulus TaxID=6551 RepID=UPI0030041153